MPAHAVQVAVDGPAQAELAAEALWGAGAVGIEERAATDRPGGVVLVAGVAPGGDLRALLDAVGGRWTAELVEVDLDAALDAWRVHARPVEVGGRLVVRPPWVSSSGDGPSGRVEVVIDPGRSFGSGAHLSTQLALVAVVRLVAGGERVLDVGCGSGVLAIAALRLGAGRAVGIDTDPAARAATVANGERNAVSDRLAVAGDLDEAVAWGSPEGYDLVVANMLLPDLEAVAAQAVQAVAAAGSLVVSGVLVDQRDRVLSACAPLVPVAAASDDGWLALTLRAA